MKEKNFVFEYGQYGETTGMEINIRGADILRYNYISKGTAFTGVERKLLKLNGFLPPRVKQLEHQVTACLEIVENKSSDIERFIYIRGLFDRNAALAETFSERKPRLCRPVSSVQIKAYSMLPKSMFPAITVPSPETPEAWPSNTLGRAPRLVMPIPSVQRNPSPSAPLTAE